MSDKQKPSVKERIREEAKEFAVIVLYLWVLLGLFALHRVVLLREHNLSYGLGFALVNALVLGKIMYIFERLHVGRRFEQKAPVYSILFKSGLFAIILLVFDILEEGVVGLIHGKTFAQSTSELGGGTLSGLLLIAIITSVSLIPFFSFTEIGRALGGRQLQLLLFHKK
jgi:hypothetical protein